MYFWTGLQSKPDIVPLIQYHPHKAAVPYFVMFQYTAKIDTTPQTSMNKEWRHRGVWFPYYTYNFREMWKYKIFKPICNKRSSNLICS